MANANKNLPAVRKGGGSLAVISEELARLAVEESANVPAAGGQFLSTKGKRFTFQDEVLPAPLAVIIVDHALSNAYYANGYEEGNPQPPDCWSIGKTEKDLVPPADLPGRQADACAGCPLNEFGTSDRGKGKACKNGRILAVMFVDGNKKITAKSVADAPIGYLRLSPTAMKPFNGFLRRVTSTLSKPLFTVVTQLDFGQSREQPVVLPTFLGEIGDEAAIRAIMEKRQGLQDELMAGYPRRSETTEQTPTRGRRGQKALSAPKGNAAKGKPAPKNKAAAAGRGTKF